AAVLGQVQATQPAEEPAGTEFRIPADRQAQPPAGRAPIIRVIPPATQPVVVEQPPVQIVEPGLPTTMPEGALTALSGPVGIQVTETGIVITAQDPQDIEYLRDLIQMMDLQPEMDFQFVPLEHATARELAQSLQDLWTKAKTG